MAEAEAEAEGDIDFGAPPWLHLLSAFLAMEPTDSLISISRICGGGSITEKVQSFVWNYCIRKADGKGYTPYVRSILKKLILEIESTGGVVCDELYEQFAFYMTSMKGDDSATGNSRVLKQVSFLFPNGLDTPTCLSSRKLLITLQCSLNMLEGDTGCSIWPSGLFLSEFILSCPEIFYMKACFEVGSGVGLVGICLAHVKASKVTLSDGDLSSLANLKLNLELNKLSLGTSLLERSTQDLNTVQYLHLPWESATESDLQDFIPDIVLGADVIYDPLCIPHLVRVLAALLRPKKSKSPIQIHSFDVCQGKANNGTTDPHYKCPASTEGPVAYIASVIRNIDTFNYFLAVADQANLTVRDITEKIKPFDLLPYMLSYQRSNVRLLAVSCVCQ